MKNFELTWSDITVSVRKKKSEWFLTSTEERIILNNANGRVQSGSFIAIMGPSGAGKSTLLGVLAGRIKDYKGSVEINGRQLSSTDMQNFSGFMNQFFIATESLTVDEHLMFMIALKARIPRDSRYDVLQKLISEIGLESCRNTQIRYLSGGEKKKIALATEIVDDPLILYCDEPTTGLDSSNAMAVMESLRAKANSGKIVMFTIHQPSSQLYNYFDQIILLASGKLIFQGTRNVMQDFFNSVNIICPKSYNPGDFYLRHLIMSNTGNLEELHQKALLFIKIQQTESVILSDFEELRLSRLRARKNINMANELAWLLWRSYVDAKRNITKHAAAFGAMMITAVVVSILFSETKLDSTGVQNFNGMLYITTAEIIYSYGVGVLYSFPEEYSIFLAEESIYSAYSYFISKVVSIIPKCIAFTVSFLFVICFWIQLPGGYPQFLEMSLIACVASYSSALFGLCVSANFQILDHMSFVVVSWNCLTYLFSGIYIKITSLATYLQWIKYLSPFYYIFQSMAIIQWMNVSHIECSKDSDLPCYKNGTKVLESLGFVPSYSELFKDMLYISITAICWSLLGLFGILRKRKN